ncbi:MAG: periplasmic heavy metal sensor [Pseudomonadota bacterium]
MIEAPNRRSSIILLVSLILNGLLIGLLIGGGLRQDRPPPSPDRGERALVRGLERSVPEDERSTVRDALRRAYGATRSERRALRVARRDLRVALAADPYNAETVAKSFEAVRQAEAAAKSGLHEELARQFERLSPEERAKILRNTDRPRRRGRPDRRGERSPPPLRDDN